jgi:hypothetical protein
MIPKIGKYYYINYEDKEQPKGSFAGLAKCVRRYERNEAGEPVWPILYEFEHQTAKGEWVLSLYYENEVILEAK